MKVYITRRIPDVGINMLVEKGYEVDVNPENRILTKEELIDAVSKKPYDAVLSLLTDTIDADVFDAVPTAKIFANYAVGFNNIDIVTANKRGIVVTNTVATSEEVAEHAVALMFALAKRIVEGDSFVRHGDYKGWDPLLLPGINLEGKTIGLIGGGRIGYKTGRILKYGLGMNVIYHDVKQNEMFEKDLSATYYATIDEVLSQADIVSLHVPLLDSTHHLINKERLALMKPTAFLINTSRGPVVDEEALVEALKQKQIAGAGLDVFEFEPKLTPGLTDLPNVVLTPHIASATAQAREQMSQIAAENIIAVLEGDEPKNKVIV